MFAVIESSLNCVTVVVSVVHQNSLTETSTFDGEYIFSQFQFMIVLRHSSNILTTFPILNLNDFEILFVLGILGFLL